MGEEKNHAYTQPHKMYSNEQGVTSMSQNTGWKTAAFIISAAKLKYRGPASKDYF